MGLTQDHVETKAGQDAKILTDCEEPRVSAEWRKRTDFRREILGCDRRLGKEYRTPRGILKDIRAAFRVFRLRRNYDVIVLGTSRVSSLFAILSALWPGKRVPMLIVPCQWFPPRNRIHFRLKKTQFKIMSRAVTKYVVWASHEVHDLATTFSIPEHKFLHIPHHHTLEGYTFAVSSGDYIFSGGDGNRDYETLLKAIGGFGTKVVIATRLSNWHGNLPVPPQVKAFPTSASDFRNWMAGSRLVVVPMRRGNLHIGGEQTYLNAMAMGKPVIVADDIGAPDYVKNGVNGLVVPSGDAMRLRAAIKSVITDPVFARHLAKNAKAAYETYSTPLCMERIFRAAVAIARDG